MWILFGVSAIIFAVLNVVWTLNHRNAKWFRFVSLSLTALTVWALYYDAADYVKKEDWSTLMDILPSVSPALLVCTVLSIAINAISLFRENK